jgi:FMN phosphatase YigB (HAD superfamily)
MELKAILFDLWGTLIIDGEHRSQPRSLWRAENVTTILREAGYRLPVEEVRDGIARAGAALSALHDQGIDLTASGRVDLVLKMLALGGEVGREVTGELETAICSMHPVHRPDLGEGALDCLRVAREMGLRIALVSNAGLTTAPSLRSMLSGYGIADYFDVCVFSDELELAKPDPRIFFEALEAIDVAPPEAAFVGDSPHNDIYGARRAGLLAVQIGHKEAPPHTGYTESDGARPDARITGLHGLMSALTGLTGVPRAAR